MLDLLVALGVALAGIVAVYFLFASSASAAANVRFQPKLTKAEPHHKKSTSPKVDSSKKAKRSTSKPEEEEEEEIVVTERQSGMTTDKARVMTLEEIKAEAAAQQRRQETTKAPTTKVDNVEQAKLIDKEKGFTFVEPKKTHKEAAPKGESITKKEAIDDKLNQFFRSQKRGSKPRETEEKKEVAEKEPANQGGRVNMMNTFSAVESKGKWGEGKQWAENN